MIIIGIDPGQSGAIVALKGSRIVACHDMPTTPRAAGGHMVNAAMLAQHLRQIASDHCDPVPVCVLEQVSAMPGQGVSSMFRFGQSDGIVRGVIAAVTFACTHGLPMIEASPNVWKRAMGLTGKDKAAALTLAVQAFPGQAELFQRKRDIGRADAALIALWWQRKRGGEGKERGTTGGEDGVMGGGT